MSNRASRDLDRIEVIDVRSKTPIPPSPRRP
jgi:hypothetical protein